MLCYTISDYEYFSPVDRNQIEAIPTLLLLPGGDRTKATREGWNGMNKHNLVTLFEEYIGPKLFIQMIVSVVRLLLRLP